MLTLMNEYHIYHCNGINKFEEIEHQPRKYVGSIYAESIERAFQRSQNDRHTNGEEEQLNNDIWNPTNPCRSTSVGDVIQDEDKFFMVCGTGFKEIAGSLIIKKSQIDEIHKAFQSLMGMNGDSFKQEVLKTGKLKASSYAAICDNISYNSQESVQKYFGLVHWYYLQGLK